MVKGNKMDVSQKLDRYDVALSISSGALTSLIDVIWIKDISLADAHEFLTDNLQTRYNIPTALCV